MNIDLLLDVLIDTVRDTLTLIPFLFVTYVVMEAIEHSAEGKPEQIIRQAGKAGPFVGALLGALPQCGFSAMAGTLYAGRIITAGTLVAVILSTSDELIPVFLAQGAPVAQLAWIVAIKVVIGVVVGFAADAVLRALHRAGDGQWRMIVAHRKRTSMGTTMGRMHMTTYIHAVRDGGTSCVAQQHIRFRSLCLLRLSRLCLAFLLRVLDTMPLPRY